MNRVFGRTWAIVSLLLGLGFLAWLSYNAFLVEASGVRVRPRVYHWAIGFAMAAVGITRIRKWWLTKPEGCDDRE